MRQLFYNAIIHTMDYEDAICHYMITKHDRILEVGADYDRHLLNLQNFDAVHNLQGAFVCPGFNDTHMHLLGYGLSLNQCNLEGVTSIVHLQSVLQAFVTTHPNGWVVGRGWNQDYFLEERLPSASDLDAICSTRPVVLFRACGHMAVVNTFALKLCNIDTATACSGGKVDLYEGNLTGILRENALILVTSQMPEMTDPEILNYLKDAEAQLLSYGITSVQTDDLPLVSTERHEALLDLMRDRKDSKIRIYEQAQFLTVAQLLKMLEKGYKTGLGNYNFKLGPLKILADGSLGSRTARLSTPYEDDPSTKGILIYSEEELEAFIQIAIEHKLDLAVHAIGDYTNKITLDFIEKHAKGEHLRHAIVHSQIMTPSLIEKMAQLGVDALVQPVFLEYDMNIVKARVGHALSQSSYAFRTMKAHGIKLGFGSDCPVENPNPMRSIHYAVTRSDFKGKEFHKEESLSLYDAFCAFTKDAAFFSREEQVKGVLKKGFLADFIILSRNPFVPSSHSLIDITVEKTYVGGDCVFSI